MLFFLSRYSFKKNSINIIHKVIYMVSVLTLITHNQGDNFLAQCALVVGE